MQLGELQNQIARFKRREVSIVAVSVDEPAASVTMVERLGLEFALGSDPGQSVVKAFAVQNPDTQELAIHAVYIVDQQGKVYYRKVGRRRPVSQELIDAIDTHRGDYPRSDEAVAPRKRIAVDYPENNFQALIAVAEVSELPETVDAVAFSRVYSLIKQSRTDDALIAFRVLTVRSTNADQQALHDAASWLVHLLLFTDNPEALEAGRALKKRLTRIRSLENALVGNKDSAAAHDEMLQTLAKARAGLSLARANISRHAGEWQLSYAKAAMRGYRAVASAEIILRKTR